MAMHEIFSQQAWSSCWMTLVLLATCTGCGSKGVVPIQPKFLLDGKPLKDASISFVRSGQEQGRASFGVTDENGVAQLTTYEPLDGVLPGNYSVVVIKAPENPMTFDVEKADTKDVDVLIRMSSMADANQPRRKRVRTVIPERYSDPGTTPLNCEVNDGSQELTFELTSK